MIIEYWFHGTSAKFSPRQQQVQNFPQLVIKFILKNIRTAGLEIPWLRVRISAGRALKKRQCTLKGQAWYVNVGYGAVYTGRECIEILDQVHKFPMWGNLCT